MPKAPILQRTAFFTRLPYDKSIRFLDFTVVETELGTMVEAMNFEGGLAATKTTDLDVYDASFTRIVEMDEGAFVNQYNTGGVQYFADFSPQGA